MFDERASESCFRLPQTYFQCVQSAGRQQAEPSKAKVHAWLATGNQPDKHWAKLPKPATGLGPAPPSRRSLTL